MSTLTRAQHELSLISELAMSVLGGVVDGVVSASDDAQPHIVITGSESTGGMR